MFGNNQEVDVQNKVDIEVKKPKLCKVVYLNDNVTTMEFVVSSLVNIFNRDIGQAVELTLEVHNNGSSVVAVLPREIAEQKCDEVLRAARNNGFPFQVALEEEDNE